MNKEEAQARDEFYRQLVYLDETYSLNDINVATNDLAYFAGIFDSEIFYGISPPHYLSISYDKQNKELLTLLSSTFGGKVSKVKTQPTAGKQVWQWVVSSHQAYKILRKIQPLLRIKNERARLCIECYERWGKEGLTSVEKNKIGDSYRRLLNNCQTAPEQRFNYFGLLDLKKAYIAGLFDVDSSFIITQRRDRESYLLEVVNRKTDYETLEFIQKFFGGKIYSMPKSKRNTLDIWELKYNSQKAYHVLQQIYPYLRAQKRIAELCTEFQEGYWQGATTKGISPERKAIGAKYTDLLRLYHLKWRSRYKGSKQK